MTKKDYEAFARMFKSELHKASNNDVSTVLTICKRTADIFGNDNPRFDRGRYLKACGMQAEDGAAR